jgi:hypothetical protein
VRGCGIGVGLLGMALPLHLELDRLSVSTKKQVGRGTSRSSSTFTLVCVRVAIFQLFPTSSIAYHPLSYTLPDWTSSVHSQRRMIYGRKNWFSQFLSGHTGLQSEQ